MIRKYLKSLKEAYEAGQENKRRHIGALCDGLTLQAACRGNEVALSAGLEYLVDKNKNADTRFLPVSTGLLHKTLYFLGYETYE